MWVYVDELGNKTPIEMTPEIARQERIALENMERPLQRFATHGGWYKEIARLRDIERGLS